ncbi:GNAT family N-acetyltransferase [uncultured Devosia sp.]|uniref:GNAT family N-acetyltransferase n=1 Tax=uncultured Devosia sp. TaxID=211434 RepID=UPI0035CA27EF
MGSGTAALQHPSVDATGIGAKVTQVAADISVLMTNRIEDVEASWRLLEASGVESPGQSYDFIALWVKNRRLPSCDQTYIVGSVDGEPVALLPLRRRRTRGVRLLSWFPGSNVGCYAPIANLERLEQLGPVGRKALWARMTARLTGADLIYLRWLPGRVGGRTGLFDELGVALPVETLYRAEFASWAECERVQRSKSRRKHDRQQGDRLDALGQVTFEVSRNGDDARDTIDTMFRQRSARFKAMGIRDIFVRDGLTEFYHAAVAANSGIAVQLQVLRLGGQIVAVRYNVVHGTRMFCLISSMSDDETVQAGSPGKQCLLRVMQSVFEQGYTMFDMGAGLTDEKRHWCNVQIPLQHHYVPLSAWGRTVLAAHRVIQKSRRQIKGHKKLITALRAPGQWLHRHAGQKSK